VASGRLVSANCTTGWFDWSAGQLWLVEDGLLRLQVPKASGRERRRIRSADAALRHVSAPPARRRDVVTRSRDLRVDPGAPEYREFGDEEPQALAGERKRNLWLIASDIKGAKLHRGILTNSLKLRMHSGPRVKLLWMRRDLADELIREALESWHVDV
jgi:hypothetical protein